MLLFDIKHRHLVFVIFKVLTSIIDRKSRWQQYSTTGCYGFYQFSINVEDLVLVDYNEFAYDEINGPINQRSKINKFQVTGKNKNKK